MLIATRSYEILTEDLNMSHVNQHIAPRILSQDQRDDRKMICGDLISSADDDPNFFLPDNNWRRNILFPLWSTTETTIRHMENDIIATTRQVKRQCYVLAVFFYSNRIVYTEFIPEDSTVNKTLYKEILGRLRDSIRRKWPAFFVQKIGCCYTTTPLIIALSVS